MFLEHFPVSGEIPVLVALGEYSPNHHVVSYNGSSRLPQTL